MLSLFRTLPEVACEFRCAILLPVMGGFTAVVLFPDLVPENHTVMHDEPHAFEFGNNF